ncbi:hypothetical protein Vadar_017604 [Vaccinium darrowii]|uniref:Uncharacterized protein n=1 Tax=Vaccinium darrowii TaxID=229202 RepID=A0ACB7XRV5_9ERIC|nr:hypothetical protein Vadar_017604 [Vaccinium darrowii]
MNGVSTHEPDFSEFVEVDPTGRYGRYNEILGKGASKTVYRGFDEYEGLEVAWNQVKLYDFLQRPEDLERLYCEIHLLKTLKHNNIMKFYTSWVDTANRRINFVTEMFTSGTLRQYRLRHKRVNLRAVKHWCRQILRGLLYLHSRDPPVIHRDLKCDNIFINGHQGEVKIGDLGLAAILCKSHAARCVGTPEFMAPEVYAEEYNELVDIYSFGMCILEMVTFEYPYSECNHPAQIYKKVISGKKPDALYKVKDPEIRAFVEKCLATVSCRLTATELLRDPFLQTDDYGFDLRTIDYCRDFCEIGPMLRKPILRNHHSDNSLMDSYSNYDGYEHHNDLDYYPVEFEPSKIQIFTSQDDEHSAHVDITINGRRGEDDGIFIRLRIADKEGRVRNIYFHFDIETDTAMSVATEMVSELDINDRDVTKIADMIDSEIASLVPDWDRRPCVEESPGFTNTSYCHNCASNATLENLQLLKCSQRGCAAVHGRFEEITYQFEGSENCVTEGAPVASSQSDGINYFDDENDKQSDLEKDDGRISTEDKFKSSAAEDYENEIKQELRWLKAKYQMQLREIRGQQLGLARKTALSTLGYDKKEPKNGNGAVALSSFSCSTPSKEVTNEVPMRSFASGKHFSSDGETKCENQRGHDSDAEQMLTAKCLYKGALLPESLQRATSLPVDAVDF